MRMPQLLFSKLIRAVVEFELLDEGDRIVLGVSGGKDSLFLTLAMAELRSRVKKNFTLTGKENISMILIRIFFSA